MAFLCHWLRVFRGCNIYPCKVRDQKDGFNRSDGSTDDCDPGLFLDHGVCSRLQDQITGISGRTLLFLILSGAATGASWLCYFKALQIGDINKVVPIDKSSTVLTILLALIFLQEGISLPKAAAVAVIAAGIFLMIEKKDVQETKSGRGGWFLYAAGSAFFASLTAILGKIGITGVESNLGTAIRTCVVLVMAWLMVLVTGNRVR